MIDETLVQREHRALMHNYGRLPVALVRGEGAHLFDADGRRYVDCIAGIGMINVGHCHPKVVEAIQRQAATLISVSNLFYTEPMITLAEWIRDRSMGGRVFFCNSGAEANEAALKLCRKYGGPSRPEVVSLVDGFHGRTYGSLSLTGQPDKQGAFAPILPGVRYVERGDVPGLAAAVGPQTCAIFIELIQGEIGVQPVSSEMLHLARRLADQHGALLVVDEIQTGMGRTGPLFAYQDAGITPDVMTLAKSLAGGVPMGAVTARPGLDEVFQPGDHGSTFAASPLAAAAALAACEVLDDPALRRHVIAQGARLLKGLQALVDDGLAVEARGKGLMCAVDLVMPRAGDVVRAMLDEGYLVNNTTPRTLRFLPPLVISPEDIDGLLAALRRVIPSMASTV